jgi:hypothetical protein
MIQYLRKVVVEGKTIKRWTKRMGKQCNQGYPYGSTTKGTKKNGGEFVIPNLGQIV